MRRILLMFALLGMSAAPAGAASFTLDSTNCTNNCYGLAWTLTINQGTYSYANDTWGYEAILTVVDDPTDGVTAKDQTISAVDFKVSNSVSSAVLYQAPTTLSSWDTYANVMSAGGCSGPNAGFICSQNGSAPALFTNGSTLTWAWYFDTSDPIFASLLGGHIGAKMTNLTTRGHLMSEVLVPEPQTLAMLGIGSFLFVMARRRYFSVR